MGSEDTVPEAVGGKRNSPSHGVACVKILSPPWL